MTSLMSRFTTAAIAAAALCGMASVAGQAQAAGGPQVACNAYHECWHIHDHPWGYPPSSGITIHSEHWVHAQGWPVSWRSDRYDRGYYRSGVWIAF